MSEEVFVSYAQNMEDVMLWRALRQAVDGAGFYIDAGAADPTALSVTRAFYDRGWRGINIEPLPEQADRLRHARPRDVVVEAMLSDRAGAPLPFHRVIQSRQTGLSTTDTAEAERYRAAGAVVETIEVPVTTLAAVCRAHVEGDVHFLKIDVEGAETAVLAGADFAAVRPWIVLVEATQPLDEAAADLGWEAALLSARYRFVWFDGLNRFYLAEEHAQLARQFEVPVNVFDNYTVYDAPLQDHLAAVSALSERRRQIMEELETEMAVLTRAAAAAEAALDEPAAPTPPTMAVVEPPPVVRGSLTIRGVVRRAVLLFYRVVRPVARPLVWRFRGFMVGPLQQEMFENRLRLDELRARPDLSARGPDPETAAAMERVLITLALEGGRETLSPLVVPAVAHAPGRSDRLPKMKTDR